LGVAYYIPHIPPVSTPLGSTRTGDLGTKAPEAEFSFWSLRPQIPCPCKALVSCNLCLKVVTFSNPILLNRMDDQCRSSASEGKEVLGYRPHLLQKNSHRICKNLRSGPGRNWVAIPTQSHPWSRLCYTLAYTQYVFAYELPITR